MTNNVVCNNQVTVKGTVATEPVFSHEIYGKKFYMFQLKIQRPSEMTDLLPIIISKNSPFFSAINIGNKVCVIGQYRSYNKYVEIEKKAKLILTVYAREIGFLSEDEQDDSQVILEGFICKNVIYRQTPLGRKIADIMLAVNRNYGQTDYIPCIAWGKDACWAATLNVGTKLKVNGRIQSREYNKKFSDGTQETRVAYEVSINHLEWS